MAHISPHNRTEAQGVVAFPETPRFFAQELASGEKKGEGSFEPMYVPVRAALSPFPCSHYYITILYRDFRRGSFVLLGNGVLCVATCAAGFVPLLSVYPGGAALLARVLSSLCLLPFTQTARASLLLFNIYVYMLPRRDDLAHALRSSSILKENRSVRDPATVQSTPGIERINAVSTPRGNSPSIVRGIIESARRGLRYRHVTHSFGTNCLVSC